MKYEVVAADAVIGWSELEKGDPPMGVAMGQMHPSENYDPRRIPTYNAGGLRVRPVGGPFFEAAGGVWLEDNSPDLGPEGIEVSVLGIDSRVYDVYFPMHVLAYKEQFR